MKRYRLLDWRIALKMLCVAGILLNLAVSAVNANSPRIKVLFLGDNGHHKPLERAADLLAPLARAGIDMAIAPVESPRIKVARQEAKAARENRPERSDGRS